MKTVVLIGASGGIGNEVGRLLLEDGFSVIGTYFEHPENVKNLREQEHFIDHYLDVRSIDSISDLHDFVKKKTKEVYSVVNCSGIVGYEGKNLKKDFQIWKDTIETNLSGNFYFAKIFFDLISAGGRFVMVSSTDSYFGGSITASYAVSKAGVNSLTKSLSLLFQDKKILVNAIAPGWVVTPMIEINGDEFLDKVATINPLKRNALPKDVYGVIKFLLSKNSTYINGQVISLEGGYTNQDPTLLLEEEVQS